VSKELAKRINIPYCFIKATNSPYYERKEYYDEIIEILKQSEQFESHLVDSTHHLHLTEPEKVAPIITAFIDKHKTATNKL